MGPPYAAATPQSSAISERILLNVREAGDEPLMMAKSFDGPIAIGRRRIDAIALLDGYLQRQGHIP